MCPPHSSLPLSLCSELTCVDTSVGPLSSSFSWVWPMERGEARSQVRVFSFSLLKGHHRLSPQPKSPVSLHPRSSAPVHTSVSLQVPYLLHPAPCQAYRRCRAALSLALGNCTIPCFLHCALRFVIGSQSSPQAISLSVSWKMLTEPSSTPAGSTVSGGRAWTSGSDKTRTEPWLCHLLARDGVHHSVYPSLSLFISNVRTLPTLHSR